MAFPAPYWGYFYDPEHIFALFAKKIDNFETKVSNTE